MYEGLFHTIAVNVKIEAWSNPHALSVNGKTGLITDDDPLLVAERFGIGTAKQALEEIEEGSRFKVQSSRMGNDASGIDRRDCVREVACREVPERVRRRDDRRRRHRA